MFIGYALMIYVLLLMLSHSIDWHLLDVVHKILNMQRYVTSVAGQACSFSGMEAKGGSQYVCLNLKRLIVTKLLGNSILAIWHHWRDRQVALENLLWRCVDYNRILWHENLPRSLSRHAWSKNNIQTRIAWKTFGNAMIYFDFERTAETKYQSSQC